MKEQNLIGLKSLRKLMFAISLILTISLISNSQAYAEMNNSVDLSLSVTGDNENPALWSFHSVTLFITNAGPDAATNVIVKIPLPAGDVYVGGSEYTSSQGNFNSYGPLASQWQVGTLASGASATLTINYFKNATGAFALFAEVFSVDQNDLDSTPGNGNGANAQEDDEAHYGQIAVEPVGTSFPNCQNFMVQAAPGATSAIANYPEPQVEYYGCQDGLTPNVFREEGPAPGSEFPIGSTSVTYKAIGCSTAEAVCTFEVIVEAAGNTGDDIDLELALAQSVENPSQWSNYSITATLTNNSSVAASGIKVELTKPEGIVYQGGNEYTASAGSFSPHNSQAWDLSQLGPNATATITINYFSLIANAPASYAQVIMANETDADSTPGNGTPPTPNEDDEASSIFTLPPNPSGNCETPISAGEFICAKTNPDGSNSLIIRNGSNDREVDINADGTLGAINNMPVATSEDIVSIQGDNVVKVEDGTGNIIYSKPIPQGLLSNYEKFDHAIEFNNGFILLAYKNLDPATSTYDAIWAIRTDSDLNPSAEKEILDGGLTYAISANSGTQVNDSQVAFVVDRGIAPSMSRHLVVVQDDLTVLSNSQYGSDNVQSLTFNPTICGSYTLTLLESAGLCTHGSCLTKSTYIGNFVNGLFVAERTRIFRSFTSMGSGTETTILSLKTQDGGMISTFYEQAVPLSSNPRANIIVTKSLNGVDQAEYIVETEADGIALLELGGTPYLLVDNNGVIELVDLNCIGPVTVTPVDYCDVQSDFPWHEWFSKININQQVIWESDKNVYSDFSNDAPVAALERGADAGYVFDITYSYFSYTGYIKYYVDFNQNGIFEESEGGSVISDPIAAGTNVVSTVAATHTIPSEAKLGETKARFILSRDPITSACDNVAYGEIEDYKVMIVDDLPNARLAKVNSNYDVYPNPVVDEVNIDISDIPNVNNISLYNAYGQLMLSKDLSRKSLDSVIKLNTSSLLDGAYFLHLSGEGFKSQGKMIIVQRLN